MNTTVKEHARFDARLLKEQKLRFEKAAILGGYRSLTDFVIQAVEEKAKEIIRDKEQVIASEKDAELFFDAITNVNPPSETLKNALSDYEIFMKND